MEDPYGNNDHSAEENDSLDKPISHSAVPPAIPVPPLESGNISQVDDIPPLKPSNWLWQSIIATILCCIPFGIIGIVFATRVDSLYYSRRYAEAEAAANKAKIWTLIAVGAGIIYLIIWIILMVTGSMPGYLENIIENNASGYNF